MWDSLLIYENIILWTPWLYKVSATLQYILVNQSETTDEMTNCNAMVKIFYYVPASQTTELWELICHPLTRLFNSISSPHGG